MTRGRVRDKTYTGHNGVATDHLRALDKLAKTPEGQYGRVSAPWAEKLREFIAAGTCPWCGRGPWKVLAGHTLRAHAVSGVELREMAGLVKDASICLPEFSQSKADARRGQRLPDSAYDTSKRTRRTFGEAGRAVQRAKLDAVRSPGQSRQAGAAFAAKMAEQNKEKRDTALRMFREGRLIRDIAKAVGLNPQAIRAHLRRSGVTPSEILRARSTNVEWLSSTAAGRQRGADSRRQAWSVQRESRMARFAALGGTYEATALLASEWGMSRRHTIDYLRKYGAYVPDGRSR